MSAPCSDRRFLIRYRAHVRGDDPGVSVFDEVLDSFVPVVPKFGSLLILMDERAKSVSAFLRLGGLCEWREVEVGLGETLFTQPKLRY